MKRFFLFFMLLIGVVAADAATKVCIKTIHDKTFQGRFVELTDSTITFIWDMNFRSQTMSASNILTLSVGDDNYIVENGKFVATTLQAVTNASGEYHRAQALAYKAEEYQRMSDSNYAIGNALRSTGGASLAFGVPSLAAGTILLIAGSRKTTDLDKAVSRGKMTTAGCVLLPFGGALTIVGVPLYVKGNQILNIKFNYTGNGAGVQVEF